MVCTYHFYVCVCAWLDCNTSLCWRTVPHYSITFVYCSGALGRTQPDHCPSAGAAPPLAHILVATDAAVRGIDVALPASLALLVSYDCPTRKARPHCLYQWPWGGASRLRKPPS